MIPAGFEPRDRSLRRRMLYPAELMEPLVTILFYIKGSVCQVDKNSKNILTND